MKTRIQIIVTLEFDNAKAKYKNECIKILKYRFRDIAMGAGTFSGKLISVKDRREK